MKFVDEASISVCGGNGGNGCVSFHRARCMPLGGPNGGNGGNGGSVYLRANENLNTLVDFRHKRLFKAQNGAPGMGSDCAGKNGEDLFIDVPPGTLVYDDETDELIGDIVGGSKPLLVARGGQRGQGNAHFKSATNRAPRQSTPGKKGDELRLRLELKIIADAGLVGLPNAGKSSLLRVISVARPKAASYPFTTLYPVLGTVEYTAWKSFVVSDLPGFIRGAADGAGLGIRFLKHVQRTRLLLHLVDIGTRTVEEAAEDFHCITGEMRAFDASLMDKTRWLVCSKSDLCPDEAEEKSCELARLVGWDAPVFVISSAARQGLSELTQAIMTFLDENESERAQAMMQQTEEWS